MQACRGTKLDHGVDVVDTASVKSDDSLDSSSVPYRKVPVEADFLFSYSTVPGRFRIDGSTVKGNYSELKIFVTILIGIYS